MEYLLSKSGYDALIILVTAHLFGDFVFQTKKLIKNKKKPAYFITHILIITLLSYVLLGAWGLWYIALIILVTHAATDLLKMKYDKKSDSKSIKYFLFDQGVHFGVIISLSFWIASMNGVEFYWSDLFGPSFIKLCILLSGLILVLKVSGIIIGMLVKPLIKKIDKSIDSKKKKTGAKGIDGGGELIGLLERLLIFFFILNGVWSAIGFLVTAKSIFRFGELKDRENRIEAEYILIGTLYSFAFGILFSWLTGFALSMS